MIYYYTHKRKWILNHASDDAVYPYDITIRDMRTDSARGTRVRGDDKGIVPNFSKVEQSPA